MIHKMPFTCVVSEESFENIQSGEGTATIGNKNCFFREFLYNLVLRMDEIVVIAGFV